MIGSAVNDFESVAFSPNGRLLATAESGRIELWNASSGERIVALPRGDTNWYFESVAFSPDGRLLAAGGDSSTPVVKLWNVSTGQSITTLSGSGPVAFSPNGRLLASVGPPLIEEAGGGVMQADPSRVVKLWNVSTGQSITTLIGKDADDIYSVAFSPNGRLLAMGSYAGTTTLWDVSEWKDPSGRATSPDDEPTIPHSLTKVSGDGQEGTVGEPLAKPFVVSVLDQNGSGLCRGGRHLFSHGRWRDIVVHHRYHQCQWSS